MTMIDPKELRERFFAALDEFEPGGTGMDMPIWTTAMIKGILNSILREEISSESCVQRKRINLVNATLGLIKALHLTEMEYTEAALRLREALYDYETSI